MTIPPGGALPNEVESHFVPLSDRDPVLAARLVERFCRRWFRLRDIPSHDFDRAIGLIDLRVADDWLSRAGSQERILRFGFRVEFSTFWLFEWKGSETTAETWIDSVAESAPAHVPNG